MELLLQRLPDEHATRTPGELFINGVFFCYTLEDEVREVPGKPVSEWKVPGETAIPAGRYWVTLEDSGRFGPDTITLNNVPGFTYIRIHSGNTEAHTEGCPLVGYEKTAADTITPGQTRSCLANLRRNVKTASSRGEKVFITILNPEVVTA